MPAKVKWSVYTDAEPDSFNVYRAITGLTLSFPPTAPISSGDEFIFAATSPTKQKVTVSGTTIDDVLSAINTQGKGITATKSDDGTKLFVRCNASVQPKLKTYNCTLLSRFSLSGDTYGLRSTFTLVGNVPFVAATYDYEYSDIDGQLGDFYRVTTLTGSDESIPSIDGQPRTTTEDLCIVEGRVITIDGNGAPGVEVRGTIAVPPGASQLSYITKPTTLTYTDQYGRFSIPLLRNQLVLLEVEAIGYNQIISVPNATAANIKAIGATRDHKFSPYEDPIGQ